MQKSKSDVSLKELIIASDIVLLILLFVINITSVMQNQEVICQLANVLKNLDAEKVIIVGSIITTILGLVINYNVLKVIFQLSFNELDSPMVLFIYLVSSILSSGVMYVMKHFINIHQGMEPVLINGIYGIMILLVSLYILYQESRKIQTNRQFPIKLSTLLIIYGLVNVLIVFFGVGTDV